MRDHESSPFPQFFLLQSYQGTESATATTDDKEWKNSLFVLFLFLTDLKTRSTENCVFVVFSMFLKHFCHDWRQTLLETACSRDIIVTLETMSSTLRSIPMHPIANK